MDNPINLLTQEQKLVIEFLKNNGWHGPFSNEQVAKKSGLAIDKVRRVTNELKQAGYVDTVTPSPYSQQKAYKLVMGS